MVPNHLFQLLTLIAMEPPSCFGADAMRSEKAKVLDAVHSFGAKDAHRNVVRAQYGAGKINGETVQPYRQAPDVPPNSTTETYVAMKLAIDNWRWAGVPFYLRTGKALARRRTRDHHPVQAGPARAVPRHAGRAPAAQRPHPAHPARRRRDPALRREDSRARRCGSTAST